MLFVGEREAVYGCVLDRADPVHSWIRCYVVVDGEADDVTDRVIESSDEQWPCAEKTAAARVEGERACNELNISVRDSLNKKKLEEIARKVAVKRGRTDQERRGIEEGCLYWEGYYNLP